MHKLTTLFENISYRSGLISGHGLSYYLETPQSKILFDTGPSDALLVNADILGIDLSEIDALVVSHGHYDHTGGIPAFLSVNSKAAIYMKEDALKEKFKAYDNYIGIPKGWEKAIERIRFVKDTTEISSGVYIIPETTLLNKEDTHFSHFFVKEHDSFTPDMFTDEQFMLIRGKENVHIISGCSHSGISNVLASATDLFKQQVGTVTGGFHLMNTDEHFVAGLAEKFKALNVRRLEVSHCTGIDQYHFLRKHFPEKVFYNHTGKTIILE